VLVGFLSQPDDDAGVASLARGNGLVGTGESLSKLSSRFDVFTTKTRY